jgi:hypothetical protein
MRKLFLLAAVVAAVAVGAGQATAKPHSGHANGGVTLANPTQYLAFSVFDHGAMADRGTVTYSNPSASVSYHAKVFCVDVNSAGKWATFAYAIPNGSLAGTLVVWHVTDGGSPGAGHDTAGFSVASDHASATTMCNDSTFTPANSYTITSGNIVVH